MTDKFTPSSDMISAAREVFESMAYVALIKPIVRKYQQKIIDEIRPKHRRSDEIITSIDKAYRMTDESFKQYSARSDIEARKAGFDVKPGYCPLLIAEDNLRKAKRRLIDAMQPITKISVQQLSADVKKFDEMIELTLGLLSQYVRT